MFTVVRPLLCRVRRPALAARRAASCGLVSGLVLGLVAARRGVLGAIAVLLCAGAAWAQAGTGMGPGTGMGTGTVGNEATLAGEVPAALHTQVQLLAGSQIVAPGGARIEVLPGTLDPRLRLAPCARIEPYLPAGARLWGSSRVGLRCTQGTVRWNVYLPVTVRVWAQALVATTPLGTGADITARDFMLAEVDIAAANSPTFDRAELVVGRRLATPLAPGATLRADMLRARQWFAAGEPVTVIARGDGFAVSGTGEALGPGVDGQTVRVRTDSGRIVVGTPVGERRVEVRL